MNDYETSIIVQAVQFYCPTAENRLTFVPPGPMKLWPDDFGNQPRDMSWGYVKNGVTALHIWHMDWIVKWPCGKLEVYRDKEFKQKFTLA